MNLAAEEQRMKRSSGGGLLVAYFSSAATPRSRGVLWPSIALPFSAGMDQQRLLGGQSPLRLKSSRRLDPCGTFSDSASFSEGDDNRAFLRLFCRAAISFLGCTSTGLLCRAASTRRCKWRPPGPNFPLHNALRDQFTSHSSDASATVHMHTNMTLSVRRRLAPKRPRTSHSRTSSTGPRGKASIVEHDGRHPKRW
jgi:hypothetical protein